MVDMMTSSVGVSLPKLKHVLSHVDDLSISLLETN